MVAYGWWTQLGKSGLPDKTSQIIFTLTVGFKNLGPLLDGLAAMVSQVSGSMLACVRDVFNWSLKYRFGPQCSLLLLVNPPNRMIHGSWVGHILDKWPTQCRWCWRTVALMLGRDVQERISLMWRILQSFVETAPDVWCPDNTKSKFCKHTVGWRGGPQPGRLWFWFL